MRQKIAIMGTGPTGVYALKALADLGMAQEVTLFEQGAQAGRGTPYAPGQTTPEMLANIGSIEIPPIEESCLAWLVRLSPEHLAGYGLTRDDICEKAFLPRLLLGEWFADQFQGVVRASGASVLTGAEVVDVKPGSDGVSLVWRKGEGVIAMDEMFRPKGMGRVHVLALPWLLERNPFVQGIGASRDLGARVVAAVALENAMIPAEGPGSLALWAR